MLFSTSGWRLALSAKTPMEMGSVRIFDLEVGLSEWIKADYPVVKT